MVTLENLYLSNIYTHNTFIKEQMPASIILKPILGADTVLNPKRVLNHFKGLEPKKF